MIGLIASELKSSPKKTLSNNRIRQLRFRGGRFLLRIRFQLGVGYLLACIGPTILYPTSAFTNNTVVNSFITASLALILGYYFVRRLTRFPGIIAISYVLPTFTATYGIMISLIFFLRLEYSTLFYLFSYLICITWFHFVFYITLRRSVPRFAIVPFGEAESLAQLKTVKTKKLVEPSIHNRRFDGIVTDLRADIPYEWQKFITETAINGVPVYHYKQITETLTGRVAIEYLSENTLGSLLPNIVYARLKFWLDLILAILLLPLFLPLFLIVALAIRLDSPGPVFFRQIRMGHRGVPFRIWKFRSMRHEPAPTGTRREETSKNDSRITRIGHFLRRTRIDELPQIFNILMGEMSWIGPRPEALGLSEEYQERLPFYRYRHIIRPGITGWAQVNQGHVIDIDQVLSKLHYDFYYIKNFSPWIDILITIRTIKTVFTGHGAR